MQVFRAVWITVWKIAVFVTVWGVLYAPFLLPVANRLGSDNASSFLVRLYAEVTGAVTILAAAWLATRYIDKRSFVSLGFMPGRMVRDVLVGSTIGSVMVVTAVVALWSLGWAIPQAVSAFSWFALLLAGSAMLANTVTQEVLVRGYIQQTIKSQFGSVLAVFLSAVMFTLLHAGAIKGALMPAVNLLAAGILLGAAYAVTNNLWLPIALHFAWNVLQGPVLGLTVSGQSLGSGWRVFKLEGPPIFTGGAFGLEGGLIATATTLLGITALLVFRLRKRDVVRT